MSDYIPPGYRSLLNHIEEAALEIDPRLPDDQASPAAIADELRRMHREFVDRSGEKVDFEIFAGPFSAGQAVSVSEIILAGKVTPHQLQLYTNAAETVEAMLEKQRAPTVARATKQVRDQLVKGELKAVSADLVPIEPLFWVRPSAGDVLSTGEFDGGSVLLEWSAPPVLRDGGRARFLAWLRKHYVDQGGNHHAKQYYFDAFHQECLEAGVRPSRSGMDEAWGAFSQKHPQLEMSRGGRKRAGSPQESDRKPSRKPPAKAPPS